MSAFSSDWLALREPADHAARDPGLAQALDAWARAQGRLRVLDLGAGTGSNLRYLAPRLGVEQRWRLLDHDADLLAELPGIQLDWAGRCGYPVASAPPGLELGIQGRCIRLDWVLEDLAGGPGGDWLTGVDLVTASALLDLTSAPWIRALAERCRRQVSAALLALSYDGRMEWRPTLPADARIAGLVNAHQRRDKGLGSALGPVAVAHAVACFEAEGYVVREARSDWRLGPESRALQERLAEGWVAAAREQDAEACAWTADWLEARRGYARRGESWLRVGHLDLLALPPAG